MKSKLRHFIPGFLYFFVAFLLLGCTRMLLREEIDTLGTTVVSSAVGAFLVSATMALLENVDFMDPFPHTPVIYNALWKSLLYIQVVFALEVLRGDIPLMRSHQMTSAALIHHFSSARFWLLQVWLVILMVLFWMWRGLIQALGLAKARELMWTGPARQENRNGKDFELRHERVHSPRV